MGSASVAASAPGVVTALAVYPVKGLSAQRLDSVRLNRGEGVPGDRAWALARADGVYRPGTRQPVPKAEFHVLVRDERLAGLQTQLDDGSVLTVSVGGHPVLRADLDTGRGRVQAEEFFARVLDLPPGAEPVVARESGRRFTDVSVVSDAMMNAVSFVNLASVRALEERIGAPVDPFRFRANVYVDGLPAWSERAIVGGRIRVGEVALQATLSTERCAATEVNPDDARRDLPVPRLLQQHFGHVEMGVYGEVREPGIVRIGDAVAWGTDA
ncbi:MOSC domain-containing protein [Herbiconiux sp. YIM B11900]|uniref:MOSC domain-containing protein n=1 Tax=Herbiconiux sp. YIM B11900 TaxID=3404131 RepID=UPI003F86B03C